MFIPINSFNDVKLGDPNTLVICDIDETLLYWKKKPEDFYQMVRDDFATILSDYTEEEMKKEAVSWLQIYKCMHSPIMTDVIGFNNLKNNINLLSNSKIIFLTARTNNVETNNKFTRNNFKSIGLEYDDYHIHYTDNKISKGEYIKEHIDLNGYDEIIFIDDYESYIKNVKDIFPNISCYKFEQIN